MRNQKQIPFVLLGHTENEYFELAIIRFCFRNPTRKERSGAQSTRNRKQIPFVSLGHTENEYFEVKKVDFIGALFFVFMYESTRLSI